MKPKYLTKHDYANSRGWNVRVPKIEEGEFLSYKAGDNHAFFKQGKGTWKACKEKALAWRDAYFEKHGVKHLLIHSARIDLPMVNSGRNTSGVIGVSFEIGVKESGEYYAYKATWCQTMGGSA